jgi:hypothetical protein|tara:strand:+ start:824 stop:1333 length:510 start_codon:yes stop_codon:yes gene_type:complete
MYFSSFPLLLYDMKGDQKAKLVTNIIKRVKVREKILDASSLYQKYFVQQGERPEDVADKHFGKSEYHWIILLTNNITDAYYGWPMGYAEFETFLKDKYTNPEAIHHHEKPQSSGNTETMIECISSDSGAVSISNREYEQRLQNDMSEIKLLDPGFLPTFLDEFDKLMSE